jgi:hypothetical protein
MGTYSYHCDVCGEKTTLRLNYKEGDHLAFMCECGQIANCYMPEGSDGYRMHSKTQHLRNAIFDIFQDIGQRMTVRQVFYQAVSKRYVEKSEKGYGQIQREILKMRREGVLPYSKVADSSRYHIKPNSYNGLKDALEQVVRHYKQSVWREKDIHVEIWLEKQALAGFFEEITSEYDVPLYTSRGFSSDSFIYESVEMMRYIGKPAVVYFFSDYDPSGVLMADAVERGFARFPDVKPVFIRAGLNRYQIDYHNVPTRNTKKSKHSAAFNDPESAELDALHPKILTEMVRDCITNHITDEEMRKIKIEEETQRDTLLKSDFYNKIRYAQ